MTTKTTTTTELRRCTGSARYGIEPHEARVSDFPKQPSQKDGLGRMCQEHWRQYTTELRKDALARQAGEAPANDEAHLAKAVGPKTVEQAEILIAVVDAMPADQLVKRVGDADVQEALEVSAAARMLAGCSPTDPGRHPSGPGPRRPGPFLVGLGTDAGLRGRHGW